MLAIHAFMPFENVEEGWKEPDKNNGWEMGTWGIGDYCDLIEEALSLPKKEYQPYHRKDCERLTLKDGSTVIISYRFSPEQQAKILDTFRKKPFSKGTRNGKTYQVKMGIVNDPETKNYIEEFEALWQRPNIVFLGA
jgi:hypothetical protein